MALTGRVTVASFQVTKVSPRIHALLQALEASCTTLGQARMPDVSDCLSRVCLTREAVYQYIEELEKKDHTIERTIVLRF